MSIEVVLSSISRTLLLMNKNLERLITILDKNTPAGSEFGIPNDKLVPHFLIREVYEFDKKKPTPDEKARASQRAKVLKWWRENRDFLNSYYTKEPMRSNAAPLFEELDKYADLLVCPNCNKLNVEAFYDDDLGQNHNLWRLQCQNCGLETPQSNDLEKVMDTWNRFTFVFKEDAHGR